MNDNTNLNSNNSPQVNNNYIINELNKENQKLKEKIKKLQASNMSISVQNEELKKIINLLKKKEKESEIIHGTITEKDNELEMIKSLILRERQNHQQDLRLKELSFENEILQMRREQDTMKQKIENFNKMNNLNDILYTKVLDLEKTIEELKKEEEMKLNNKEIEYNNKIDKYKKRLIDFLKKGDKQKDADDQLALNNKLNILHIQELISEIEFQNHEVNNLLRERKDLKIKIINLSSDLNIYKIMVKTLAEKNDEFQKKLKLVYKPITDKFSLKYKSHKIISKTDNNVDINKEIFDKKFKIYSPISRKKNANLGFDLRITNKKKNKNKMFINNTISNNTSPTKLKLENDASISKRIKPNEFFNEKKEKEKFKDLYEFYKEKYEITIKKFKSIFEMYDNTLEKIYYEELNNKNNDISININDFKDFKFENMSPEHKYSILIKLINQIAPLICKKDFEENSFRDKVFKVKQKYNIFNVKNKSIFSKTQKSFELNEKLINKEKILKSPKGCTITTYISPEHKNNEEQKILNFNKHYSNLLKFTKYNGQNNISQNLKIPRFEYKINDIHNSPFTYY